MKYRTSEEKYKAAYERYKAKYEAQARKLANEGYSPSAAMDTYRQFKFSVEMYKSDLKKGGVNAPGISQIADRLAVKHNYGYNIQPSRTLRQRMEEITGRPISLTEVRQNWTDAMTAREKKLFFDKYKEEYRKAKSEGAPKEFTEELGRYWFGSV